MAKPMKQERMPLMWQYFFSYLAVMVVLIITLFGFAYNSFYRYHREIMVGNYEKEIALIGERNASELNQLVNMANQITASPDVTPFQFSKEPEKSYRLKTQLASYKSCNDFAYGMYLIFDSDDYVYSPVSSYRLDNFANSAAQFGIMTPAELIDALRNTRRINMKPMQSVQGYLFTSTSTARQMMPVFLPIGYNQGIRSGIMMFLVDQSTYIKLFSSVAPGAKDIYILGSNGVLVSRNISGVPEEMVIEKLGEKATELNYQGKNYLLVATEKDSMDLSYLMMVSEEETQLAFAGSMKLFIVVLTLISALCLLFITRFVQSRIKPIRLVHSMISDRRPSGNELMEIRDGVQKLIDENASLNTQMESVETLRKADFARRFLTGEFASMDECLNLAEKIHVNIDTRFFAVAIIAKPQGAEYDMNTEKLNHLFDDEISGVARTLGLDNKMVLIAFGNEEARLFDWLEGKFAGLRACCAGVAMAASSAHTHYTQGQHAYLEAENAFENRFIQGNSQLIRFTKTEGGKTDSMGNAQQVVERLGSALKAGEGQRAYTALNEISKIMRGMNTTLFGFRCLYNDILNVITAEVLEQDAHMARVYDLFSLSQCLSLDDLDTMLKDTCTQIIKAHGTAKNEEISGDIIKARELIHQRFSEPGLSVSSIAQELGLSDSRLSVDFKKAYQITPLECLTQIRMRQARRLLCETDMPVKDIALECGYYDVSGFNRRFKAYTGMTPQQYRQADEGNERHE